MNINITLNLFICQIHEILYITIPYTWTVNVFREKERWVL